MKTNVTHFICWSELNLFFFQGKSVPLFSKSRRLEILQNAGYQQLITGNPLLAFKCFREALAICYRQPLLWLRLSECCVAYHVKQVIKENEMDDWHFFVTSWMKPLRLVNLLWQCMMVQQAEKNMLLSPIHSNWNQSIQIQTLVKQVKGNNPSKKKKYNSTNIRFFFFGSSSQSNLLKDLPSAESGIRCAQTVLNLLNKPNQNEDISLRQSALANLAYLSLAIGDPVVALNAARDLLSIPAESHFKSVFFFLFEDWQICLNSDYLAIFMQLRRCVGWTNLMKLLSIFHLPFSIKLDLNPCHPHPISCNLILSSILDLPS